MSYAAGFGMRMPTPQALRLCPSISWIDPSPAIVGGEQPLSRRGHDSQEPHHYKFSISYR
jgi:hypothetical protein